MKQTTKITLAVAVILSTILSACGPRDIQQGVNNTLFTNTSAEQQVTQFFCEKGNLTNPDCK